MPASNAATIPVNIRSLSRWNVPVHNYARLDDFLNLTTLPAGVHVITQWHYPIEFYVRPRTGKPLIFLFHANVPRSAAMQLPVFQGLGMTADLDAGVIAFADPALYADPDLTLGWHAGLRGLKIQTIFASIIQKILQLATPSRVIFSGGSGGGFAALYYSCAVRDSISVVWNAQTNILDYAPFAVERYARAAFDIDAASIKTALPQEIVCDVIDLRKNAPAFVFYMQNNSDWHVTKHMNPLLSASHARNFQKGDVFNGLVSPHIWLQLQDWGNGHTPPPPDAIKKVLKLFVDDLRPWESVTTARASLQEA